MFSNWEWLGYSSKSCSTQTRSLSLCCTSSKLCILVSLSDISINKVAIQCSSLSFITWILGFLCKYPICLYSMSAAKDSESSLLLRTTQSSTIPPTYVKLPGIERGKTSPLKPALFPPFQQYQHPNHPPPPFIPLLSPATSVLMKDFLKARLFHDKPRLNTMWRTYAR